MPSPIVKGLATIKWGTSGLALGALATAVVQSMSIKSENYETKIEDNDGFTKAFVLIVDGQRVTIECLYDSAITWPAEGTVLSMQPVNAGSASNFLITKVENAAARKKEATISLELWKGQFAIT